MADVMPLGARCRVRLVNYDFDYDTRLVAASLTWIIHLSPRRCSCLPDASVASVGGQTRIEATLNAPILLYL